MGSKYKNEIGCENSIPQEDKKKKKKFPEESSIFNAEICAIDTRVHL